MRTVTASEAKQRLARVIEATRRGSVLIERQKRGVAVIMSVEEYERLVYLNIVEFQQFCDQVGASAQSAGMTEDVLQELLKRED